MKAYLLEKSARMGRALTEKQAGQICAYHEILIEVNKSMNLTRVPDTMAEAADRNYLDSITPLIHGLPEGAKTLADVGSGAGFPGIPLAIMLPDVRITLIDALDKRVKFLNDVIKALDLNAVAVHARCEDAGKKPELREQFDIATSRAVASLNILCELSLPLVKVGGQMIAYKGPIWQEEAAQAENALSILGGQVAGAKPADIPGRDWNHMLVYIDKVSPTPEKYPRRPGVPEKKPL